MVTRQRGIPPSILRIILILAGMIVLSACESIFTSTPDDTPEPEPRATETEDPSGSDEGGTLVVALPEEPSTLNFTLTSDRTAFWVLSTLNDRMIQTNANGELEPVLLREIPTHENGGISEDGLTYTLRFLPDLYWDDEQPLTAHDLYFTWQTITDGDYPGIDMRGWNLVTDISVSEDDLTALIRLRRPSPEFVRNALAGTSNDHRGLLLPMHAFEDIDVNEIPGDSYGAEENIGNGPFDLVSWEPGEEIIVERSETYHGDEALLDRIIFRFPEYPRQVIEHVISGEVDLAAHVPESALIEIAASDDAIPLIRFDGGAIWMYGLNLNNPEQLIANHPILSDEAVREAMLLGFDRGEVNANHFFNESQIASVPLAETPWDPALEPVPYDPDAANDVLNEAGWVRGSDGIREQNGVRLTLTHTTLEGDSSTALLHQRIQAAFIEDMEEIGIEIEPENILLEEFRGTEDEPGILYQRQFDIIDLSLWSNYPLYQFVQRFSGAYIPTDQSPYGENVIGYDSEEVNELLARYLATFDAEERKAILMEVQRVIADDTPILPIVTHLETNVARRYVNGLEPGSISGLWWNAGDWWISREEID